MSSLPVELIWCTLKLLPESKLIIVRLVSLRYYVVSTDIIRRRLPYPLSTSIEATYDDVYTYLLKCCNRGHVLSLKHILDEFRNDDIRMLSYFPSMPIVWGQCMLEACKSGHSEIVKMMLKFGADMYLPEGLRKAAYGGYYETVRVIIDNGYMMKNSLVVNIITGVLDYVESANVQSFDPKVNHFAVIDILLKSNFHLGVS